MGARGRGARAYPLGELTAGELEALTFLLARAEDKAVVPVRNQDRGLDVRLPDMRQLTRRGWQAKRFEKGKIHWGQCRGSVETMALPSSAALVGVHISLRHPSADVDTP